MKVNDETHKIRIHLERGAPDKRKIEIVANQDMVRIYLPYGMCLSLATKHLNKLHKMKAEKKMMEEEEQRNNKNRGRKRKSLILMVFRPGAKFSYTLAEASISI